MTSQWNTKTVSKSLDLMQKGVLEEDVVILLQGRNTFGDRIYSFLKLTLKNLMQMQQALQTGAPFTPSDFGTVVAAGTGEPPDDVKAEIASMYKFVNTSRGIVATNSPPPAPKAWDEY